MDGRSAGHERSEQDGRRYHWHSASVRDFTSEPHTGIVGEHQGTIMNLVDAKAKDAQSALLPLAKENPDITLNTARKLLFPHAMKSGHRMSI